MDPSDNMGQEEKEAKQASDAAAATARAQEEAEAKSSAAGGVAATETAWKRMSINSATAKFAMRRRIAMRLSLGNVPRTRLIAQRGRS